jgi:hypothetical protein
MIAESAHMPVITRWKMLSPLQKAEIGEDRDLLEEIHRLCVRERALNDFWFFVKYVLQNPYLYEPLHRPICEWLQTWNKRSKLFLDPRGHIKSNIATVAFGLWEICKNRNIRILLGSHTQPDSAKFMNGIKNIIESNERFRYIFPDIRPARKKNSTQKMRWSDTRMLVQRDKEYEGLIENTVEAASFKTNVVGRHYDGFLGDDLVTEDSVKEPKIMLRTVDDHAHYQSLLDPGAWELLVGTRYDHSDLYGSILEDKYKLAEYDVHVGRAVPDQQVIVDIIEGKVKWTPSLDEMLLFPTRFTLDTKDFIDPDGNERNNKKSLPSIYVKQGSWIYSCQYGNDPVDPTKAIFKRKFIDDMWVDTLPVDVPLRWFRVCDLASESETEAYTAIVYFAIGPRATIYVPNIFWGQYSGLQISDELFSVPEGLQAPEGVAFEPGPYERSLKPWLEAQFLKRGHFLPLMWLPTNQAEKPKKQRIAGLQPWFESGKIKVVRGIKNAAELETEMTRFTPRSKYRNDIIDAIATGIGVVFPGGTGGWEQDEKGDAEPDWFAKLGLDDQDRSFLGQDRVMPGTTAFKIQRRR